MGLPIAPCSAPAPSRTPAPSQDKAEVTAVIAIHEPLEDVELSAILKLTLLPSLGTLQGKKHLFHIYLLIFPSSTFPGPVTSTTLTIVKIMAPSRA